MAEIRINDPLILSLPKDVGPGAARASFDTLRTSG
jgi:hypothetical protein